MAEETKTLEQWEHQKHWMVKDPGDLKKHMTEAEFDAIPLSDRHGVQHVDRTEFLKANGFAVDRKNMMDSRLSSGHTIVINGEILDYDEYIASGGE